MKHRKAYAKLSRDTAHRVSMLNNMSASLIKNEKIVTTLAKAKTLRPYVEKMITKAKKSGKSIDVIRELKVTLKDPESLAAILNQVSEKYKDRNGGYLRIIKLGFRQGDRAKIALVELV